MGSMVFKMLEGCVFWVSDILSCSKQTIHHIGGGAKLRWVHQCLYIAGKLPLATRDGVCIPTDAKVIFSNPRNDRKEHP